MASAVEPGATKSPQVGNSTFLIPQANKYDTTGRDSLHNAASRISTMTVTPTAPQPAPASDHPAASPFAAAGVDDGMPRRCVIVAAGPRPSVPLVRRSVSWAAAPAGPRIVAADGGLAVLEEAGIRADALIGDLDSAGRLGLTDVDVSGAADHVIRLPHDKDDIDLVSAVRWAWDGGAREFVLLGALGGRPDMDIASLQLSALISRSGGFAVLENNDWSVAAISDGSLRLRRTGGGGPVDPVSVLALSDMCSGVGLTGLRYGLTDAVLRNTSSRWTSNECLAGRDPAISVRTGTLAVVWPTGLEAAAWSSRYAAHPTASLGNLDLHRSPNLIDG